ncbi:MAG TPA: hypothetical protein VIW29_04670 [Polyangiaceae bacterium]
MAPQSATRPKKTTRLPSPPATSRARRPRPRASTELRRALAASLALLLLLLSPRLSATPTSVLVEIDVAAERIVDARSTRRLVPLELADVAVPASVAESRRPPVLFFRVLGGSGATLRLELWVSGEYHGARTLNGAGENPQLVARRVALAAAELGRRLARKRIAALARDSRLRQAEQARERERRERTQEGPLALRSELMYGVVPGKLQALGVVVSGELTLRGPLRLDVGASFLAGKLDGGSVASMRTLLEGLSFGPAYRLVLTRTLDLDLGATATAQLLQVPSASTLDGVADQDSSWTARTGGSARFQLRLTRQLRASLGGELGALLRSVHYTGAGPEPLQLNGVWWGALLGIVVTPAI